MSRKRVARVMRKAGLAGVSRRKGPRTTRRDPQARSALGLVERRFDAYGPNRLGVAGITCVPTAAGFVHLAAVLDVFSRRVVGWAMANPLRTERVLAALNRALGQRRPASIIHPCDQGCQHTSPAQRPSVAAKQASSPRWARSGTMTTTPWPGASSPASNANSSAESDSMTIAAHGGESSPASRDGITRTVVTKAWGTGHRSTSRAPTGTLQRTQAVHRPLKRINSNM